MNTIYVKLKRQWEKNNKYLV